MYMYYLRSASIVNQGLCSCVNLQDIEYLQVFFTWLLLAFTDELYGTLACCRAYQRPQMVSVGPALQRP